ALRLVCLSTLTLFHTPSAGALDSGTTDTIRAATFEFLASSEDPGLESLVGTAFAIGPNEFVTAAHLLDGSIGSHFRHPELVDSHHVAYRIADILQYSQQQDYVSFSLEHPPSITPLQIASRSQGVSGIYFVGWRPDGKITIERGTYFGLTADE